MHLEEVNIQGPSGRLALKIWGEPEAPPVLALHGWMDNAATFDALAPQLRGLRLIAPDLPGHGLSAHRPPAADYSIWSYVADLLAISGALSLPRFRLLGHSMGGSIATLFAALYPERVVRLALLDAVGPLNTEAARAPDRMRRSFDRQSAGNNRPRYYGSREEAEAARASKGLGMTAAGLLGARGISQDDEGWYWHNDRRLALLSPLSMTEEQAVSFLRNIRAPTLLISAPAFWRDKGDLYQRRLPHFRDLRLVELGGHHHQHLEGHVDQVAEQLLPFLLAD